MTFIDTNVIIDIFRDDPIWKDWSLEQVSRAVIAGRACINAIVFAELSRGFPSATQLSVRLAAMSLEMLVVDEPPAFVAGKRFAAYRRSGNRQQAGRPLPDFFIGAHAVTLGMPLLTRDPKLYRAYFPELTLITPEIDHG